MKKLLFMAAFFAAVACGADPAAQEPEPATCPDTGTEIPAVATPAFAKGADIGWASEMEAGGRTFQKKDGTKAALLDVLKDCGINAIRLRVWVNPYKGYCGMADVLAAAWQVSAAGLALMVDFHYSDFFADPGRQKVPSAWEADKNDLTKMAAHVKEHTTEVLQALKDAGVTVNWVQIGNETRNGMLWPAGQLWTDAGDIADGRKHFAQLFNAGYDAAKALYPDALVMPHLNNAYEDNGWWFSQMKAAGLKLEAIALSHYPQAESKYTAAQYNQKAIDQIKSLYNTYKVPVIVSEVGVKTPAGESTAKGYLQSFMTELKKISGCAGVFYWEPEVDGSWRPAIYTNLSELSKYSGKTQTSAWGAYDMGAFTTAGKPTSVMDVFAP